MVQHHYALRRTMRPPKNPKAKASEDFRDIVSALSDEDLVLWLIKPWSEHRKEVIREVMATRGVS